jgi:hypothetical protein
VRDGRARRTAPRRAEPSRCSLCRTPAAVRRAGAANEGCEGGVRAKRGPARRGGEGRESILEWGRVRGTRPRGGRELVLRRTVGDERRGAGPQVILGTKSAAGKSRDVAFRLLVCVAQRIDAAAGPADDSGLSDLLSMLLAGLAGTTAHMARAPPRPAPVAPPSAGRQSGSESNWLAGSCGQARSSRANRAGPRRAARGSVHHDSAHRAGVSWLGPRNLAGPALGRVTRRPGGKRPFPASRLSPLATAQCGRLRAVAARAAAWRPAGPRGRGCETRRWAHC